MLWVSAVQCSAVQCSAVRNSGVTPVALGPRVCPDCTCV